MLRLDNVAYTYPGASGPTVEGLSLQLSSGEYVALTGPNGSGKSTVVALTNGSLVPSAGTVSVDGLLTRETRPSEVARLVGVVRQDPRTQLLEPSVFDEVAFGPRCLGLSASEVKERAVEALTVCGIANLIGSETRTLSGGQQQLLALAGVLAMHPRYLVLDEALTFLDSRLREEVHSLIMRLCSRGVGILQVTHRAEEIARADRVHRLDAVAPMEEPSKLSIPASFTENRQQTLLMDDVTVSMRDRVILSHQSLTVPAGRLTLLCGPSGSGKTTASRVLAGVLKPNSGWVLLGTKDVRPGMVGLACQHPEDQLFADTVWDDIAFGPRNLGLTEEEVAGRVTYAMESFGLAEELGSSHPMALSGGQRRRVALAGILAMRPEAYVFDEPTAGLDESGISLFRRVVEDLVAGGSATLAVTHDPDDWKDVASATHYLSAQSDFAASSDVRLGEELHAGPVLVALILITAALFAATSWRGVALGAALALICLIAERVRPQDALHSLRAMTVVFVFVLVANGVVVDGTADLPLIGTVGLSAKGLLNGATSVARIITMVSLVASAARRLSASAVSSAVVSMLWPFKALGIPVADVAMVISIALQSIPETMVEFARIKSAQEARGAHLSSGTLFARLRTWSSILVPLVVSIFQCADDLARSMRDRCYEGHLTRMGQGLTWQDLVLIVVAALLSLAIWLA